MSDRLRTMILDARVPTRIEEEILKAYADLEQRVSEGVRISIRSSAVGEDGDASFAGQFTSVLNVTKQDIIEAYKTLIASKSPPRAISYRLQYGLDDRETPMCVLAVAMIDARASGVAYTIDPNDAASGLMRVNALWGLGDQLVGGSGVPDSFLVDKGYARITSRVDTMPYEDSYKKQHVPGAAQFEFPKEEVTSLDGKTKAAYEKLLGPDKDRLIVIYCGFTKSGRSHIGAMWAVKLGYKNVYRYPGGIKAWMEADYPTEKVN